MCYFLFLILTLAPACRDEAKRPVDAGPADAAYEAGPDVASDGADAPATDAFVVPDGSVDVPQDGGAMADVRAEPDGPPDGSGG